MSEIILSPELIETVEKSLDLSKLFLKSKEITAKHKLFEKFSPSYPNMPKLIFYILMQNKFGMGDGKDKNNDLGYLLCWAGKLNKED